MGFEIIEPIVGNLACGDSGKGHIAKVSDVINFILTSKNSKPL
jgi:phosphopantothenoylcysteine synthetase/decarboxylase